MAIFFLLFVLFLLQENLLCLVFWYVFLYICWCVCFISRCAAGLILKLWLFYVNICNCGKIILCFCYGRHACECTQTICWYLLVFLMINKCPCNDNWPLQSHQQIYKNTYQKTKHNSFSCNKNNTKNKKKDCHLKTIRHLSSSHMSPVKPSLVIIQQTIENHHKQHNPNEKRQTHNRQTRKKNVNMMTNERKHPNNKITVMFHPGSHHQSEQKHKIFIKSHTISIITLY